MKRLLLILLLGLLLPLSSLVAQTAGDNIDVAHYEIHIWGLDFTNHTLQGETFIGFTATAPTNTVVLELKSLTVSDVACDYYSVENYSQ